MTYGPIDSIQSYLPIEFQIEGDEEYVRELIASRERLTADIVNIKENAQYEKRELVNAQQWFNTNNSQFVRQPNYAYRLTFDLVSLNGGNIPNGTTVIALPTDPTVNVPTAISYPDGLIPLHGFGGATIGTTYYFINDPNIYVRYTNTSTTVQSVTVVNSTGSAITQFYWCFEYLKN